MPRTPIVELAEPYVATGQVVGLTVGVVRGKEHLAVGVGRVADSPTAATPDGSTVYEIASVTKVLTGILLADAVEQGRVQLDTPVSELLPAGVTMHSHADGPMVLRDLSTHASGLPRLPENLAMTDPADPYCDYTFENLHEFLSSHRPSRAPGAKFEYSNLGVGLLGYLLATEHGVDYEALLRERLTKPLGMNSTVIALTPDLRSRLARPYDRQRQPAKNWEIPTLAGAGGVRSTVDDLLRLMAACLHPPQSDVGRAIELAWQVHRPASDGAPAMGLGWHLSADGESRWHNGETGGYHSMLLMSRRHDLGVVVLANTATDEIEELAHAVFAELREEIDEPAGATSSAE